MDLLAKTVIVTGASGGIGASLTRLLVRRGAVVLAVARSADRLEGLRDELSGARGRVEPVPLDLTDRDAGARLEERVGELGLRVEGLVNNAGLGGNGDLVDLGVARSLQQVDLDVRVLVELTARFLPAMVSRGSGFVVNIGSTAGFQPVPGMAVYAASKAFVRSFTEAVWFETKESGVRVVGVAPGPVETGFFDAAGGQFMTKGRLSADDVAAFALRHLDGTGPMVVPGWRNRVGAIGGRFAPRRLLIAAAQRMTAPE